MNKKPKHPWFRFHLSTAVFAMMLFGGFLFLNRPEIEHQKWVVTDLDGKKTGEVLPYDECGAGWPFHCYGEGCSYAWFEDRPPGLQHHSGWHVRELIYDIVIALVVVVYAASIWERLIRRREARKT